MKIKLSWELVNSFSEFLNADSDDEDEEEVEAYNDSIQRLKVSVICMYIFFFGLFYINKIHGFTKFKHTQFIFRMLMKLLEL
jgi:hypothetical protein